MSDDGRTNGTAGGDANGTSRGTVGSAAPTGPSLSLNRRDFLTLGATAMVAATACNDSPVAKNGVGIRTGESAAAVTVIDHDLPISATFTAVRKEDFVVLQFDFVNMVPDVLHSSLQRANPGPAFVIVQFPPQHVFEAAYKESNAPDSPGDQPQEAPVGARLSGASRVAFAIPDNIANVAFTLNGLLDLIRALELRVSKNALPAGQRTSNVGPLNVPPALVPLIQRRGGIIAWILRLQRTAVARQYGFFNPNPNPVDPTVTVDAGAPQAPWNHETSIELPFRMLMSPDKNGAFNHALNPVQGDSGRTELWHTRLGVRKLDGTIDEVDPSQRTARALWTRDARFDEFVTSGDTSVLPPSVFAAPELETLSSVDRAHLVNLTSNFVKYATPPTVANPNPLPRPVDVNRLMLSSAGGWLDVKGSWPDSQDSILEWEHRATQGRDHYVKVVSAGILFPWGHRAALVKVSERKFKGADGHIAFLRQRKFIVILEPERMYDDGRADTADDDAKALRKFPFVFVRAKTLITPNLDIDDSAVVSEFVPTYNGTYDPNTGSYSDSQVYRFEFEALDGEGNLIRFSAPAVWKMTSSLTEKLSPPQVQDANAAFAKIDRSCGIGGQRFAYADAQRADDTSFETSSVTFSGAAMNSPSYPGFLPVIDSADLTLESVRQVTGASGVATYEFHEQYVTGAFTAANKAELLFGLKSANSVSVDLGDNKDRSGGFIAPSLDVQAVSRKIGPVSAAAPLVAGASKAIDSGQFDPSEYFASFNGIKLFGVFNLTDVLDAIGIDRAPKYITQILSAGLAVVADLTKLAEDLKGWGVPDSIQPIKAINDLGNDLSTALNPTAADQAAAASRIATDLSAVITALGNIQSAAAAASPLPIKPEALKQRYIERAQALVAAIPGVQNELLQQVAALGALEFPNEIHTKLEWSGKLKDFGGIFTANTKDGLLLTADIRARADNGGSASIDLRCSLEDFTLSLLQATGDAHFISLDFNKIEFKVLNGKKPDVAVDLRAITFHGPLSFIERLKQLIPLQGLVDPPALTLDSTGITASFSLALPAIAVGVFSLENIALSAALRLPFIGDPLTFTFDFSTRDNPFNLTVALLGGGGFFGLSMTAQGIVMIEAALEAGARLSINLGVASGSVSATLGVYFRLEAANSGDQVTLTGYFRLRGQLEVLGIITISAQLALELSYEDNKLVGRASIEVEIDILFFSASVTVTCERKFAGSNGDPTFLDIMKPNGSYQPWNDYLAAFAA